MGLIELPGRLLPKGVRDKYHQMMGYSTIKTKPDTFLGTAILAGLILSFVVTLLTSSYHPFPLVLVFVGYFMAVEIMVYTWIGLNISSKASQVDIALPDALQLMSSNIRAGLTIDKALILAARPEFGALEEEIRRVGRETMAGRNLSEAIERMTLHIRSDDLDRTVELIVSSLRSGGQLADLLDQTAEDIRDQQLVRKEISASVLMYVLFIFIAIVIGAPLLFAMSSFLVNLLTMNMNMIAKEMPSDFDGMGGAPIKMGAAKISIDFIRTYTFISITLSCIFGAIIMGLILKGEEKQGLKYLPVMLIVAHLLYYVGSLVLESTIGGMMPTG